SIDESLLDTTDGPDRVARWQRPVLRGYGPGKAVMLAGVTLPSTLEREAPAAPTSADLHHTVRRVWVGSDQVLGRRGRAASWAKDIPISPIEKGMSGPRPIGLRWSRGLHGSAKASFWTLGGFLAQRYSFDISRFG